MLRFMRYTGCFLVTAAAALLLRTLAAALPCPAVMILTPVTGSPWEQGKLLFWPSMAGMLLLWRLECSDSLCRGRYCAALLVSTGLMIALCSLLRPLLPLPVLFTLAAAGGLTLYHFVLRRRLHGSGLPWYLAATLMGVAYLLLTACPPTGGIFRDASAMAAIPF